MYLNDKKMKSTYSSSKLSDIALLGIFIFMGILVRTLLVGWNVQPFPNFEIIMILTFLAALFIRPTLAFLVPLGSMIGSDILLGNSIFVGDQMNQIVLFTYSGFLLICLINIFTKNALQPRLQQFKLKTVGLIVGVGVIGTLCYDVWTNIGWWYLLFPHTLEALTSVFLAGLPFMLYHLLSTVLTFICLGIPAILLIRNMQPLTSATKRLSFHHLPIVAVTLLLIGLSLSGTATNTSHNTDFWLDHTDSTSVTISLHGNDWSYIDRICVPKETTVFSLLLDMANRHGIDVATTFDEMYNATIVTSIGDSVNGDHDAYWWYYVNGEIPLQGCDKCTISNGDVVVWSYERIGK